MICLVTNTKSTPLDPEIKMHFKSIKKQSVKNPIVCSNANTETTSRNPSHHGEDLTRAASPQSSKRVRSRPTTSCSLHLAIIALGLLAGVGRAASDTTEFMEDEDGVITGRIPWEGGIYAGNLEKGPQGHFPHGEGTFKNGDLFYTGEWEAGHYSKGTLTYGDSDSDKKFYEGEFDDKERPHKQGMMFYHDGRVLGGQWENGRLREGTITYLAGNKRFYEGMISKKGRPHGLQGKLTFRDGTVQEGEFSKGRFVGRRLAARVSPDRNPLIERLLREEKRARGY